MAWTKQITADIDDTLIRIRDFASKTMAAGPVTPGGGNTGDGNTVSQSADQDSVAETWTATCTVAGGASEAEFSVSGSVTGSLKSATANVAYSRPGVSFVVLAGDVDFVIGDTFSFAVAASTAEWTVMEQDVASPQKYIILKGIGGGTDEIYVGFRTHTTGVTTDLQDVIELTAFSDYNGGLAYIDQPGYRPQYIRSREGNTDFWIRTTPRHIMVVGAPLGVYDSGYVGWYLPYATPAQYIYPMCVAGTCEEDTALTSEDTTVYAFWRDATGYLPRCSILKGNVWFDTRYATGLFDLIYGDALGGGKPVYEKGPMLHADQEDMEVFGSWEGLYSFANAENMPSKGSVLSVGSSNAMVAISDTHRIDSLSWAALELMPDTQTA
jgi:hypothetical protein